MAPMTAPDRLAKARERFLAAEPLDSEVVRRPILASWMRSRHWRVAADHIELRYIREPDPETALIRAADPVLRRLHEQLDGQPISIILTDAHGLVLSRRTADRDLERYLESVMLAPGFSYAEELVGTNGIGTALEAGGPAHVFGHEHYAERLEGLACAGVPLHDPITGKTVGLIDLTCWRRNADALLLSLVQATAEQISQALAAASCDSDVQLLEEYVRACRRSGGIVLALGDDVVMMNDHARSVLDRGDQETLIDRAIEVLGARPSGTVTVELPSGAAARMSCRRVGEGGPAGGGVVQVRMLVPAAPDVAAPPRVSGTVRTSRVAVPSPAPKAPMCLPGLVGNGVLWLRACRAAQAATESAEWLALEGEAGAGKLAIARAVQQRQNPAAPFHVLDAVGSGDGQHWAAQARRELLEGTGVLVIQHVQALTARQLHGVTSALQEAWAQGRQSALRVVVTLHRDGAEADLTKLLRFFPRTVEVPPLRHHVEDLHELVPFLLARLSQQGRVTCSPEAMQLMMRHSWPGNVEQLWQVLKQVVQSRRSGAIKPRDLPPECWTVSRRLLNPLESLERDAIVLSLLDHDGNKVKAAEALGMSRATIYRKIHEYGIVTVSK
jgi:sigma-54 dependent transcriptional regulator, acetoin dehydrogenase operon transcriptional activator AcoR